MINEPLPLKDKKAITPEYVQKLRDYILKHQNTFFRKENEADAWCDFVKWPDSKTDRRHLCMPGEPFLVDRSVDGDHVYCVSTISENAKITMEVPVIKVSELYMAEWKNGYFLLPQI